MSKITDEQWEKLSKKEKREKVFEYLGSSLDDLNVWDLFRFVFYVGLVFSLVYGIGTLNNQMRYCGFNCMSKESCTFDYTFNDAIEIYNEEVKEANEVGTVFALPSLVCVYDLERGWNDLWKVEKELQEDLPRMKELDNLQP